MILALYQPTILVNLVNNVPYYEFLYPRSRVVVVHRCRGACDGNRTDAVVRSPPKSPAVAALSVAVDIRSVALPVGGESDKEMIGGEGRAEQAFCLF
jgi:hypothetical protein